MKKGAYFTLISMVILSFIAVSSCKTTDETVAENFSIQETSGYSLNATVIPKNNAKQYKLTSINLFAAVHNHTDRPGTITGWSFKIKRNIVTIVEINQNNYMNYNLALSGSLALPADEIIEFNVATPQPFLLNALPEEIFTFAPYVPTEVIAEFQISDQDGNTFDVTASGDYTFEETTIKEN